MRHLERPSRTRSTKVHNDDFTSRSRSRPPRTVTAQATRDGAVAGPVGSRAFDLLVNREKWRVAHVDSQQSGEGEADNAIDGNPETYWHTQWAPQLTRHPHEIRIDLGESLELRGVTYLPRQDMDHGRIGRYAVYVSQDGKTWRRPAAEGRFQNSTALQIALFTRSDDRPLHSPGGQLRSPR